jgi:hypothetical protein
MSEMSRMKTFGAIAAALLCVSLARPGRAAADGVDHGQGEEAVAREAAPPADGTQVEVTTPAPFAFADANLSDLMSHQAPAIPTTPPPSLAAGCELICCIPLPLGPTICCSEILNRCIAI